MPTKITGIHPNTCANGALDVADDEVLKLMMSVPICIYPTFLTLIYIYMYFGSVSSMRLIDPSRSQIFWSVILSYIGIKTCKQLFPIVNMV